MKRKTLLIVAFHFSLFTFHFGANAQSWLWGKYGVGDAFVFSIAANAQGDCYISVFFNNNKIIFGADTLSNNTPFPYNDQDVGLVKFDHNGDVIWAKQTFDVNSDGNAVTSGPCSISLDKTGNIYENGNFPDTLIVGTYTLVSNYRTDWNGSTFLAKYDPNGNVLWAKQSLCGNDSSIVSGFGISTDMNGNSYITGGFLDTVIFGTTKIWTPSTSVVFGYIAKYDSNGNFKWVRQSTGKTKYGATSIAVGSDNYGNSYITGYFGDTIVFGSYKLISNSPYQNAGNLFVVKYDSNGNVKWAQGATLSSGYSGIKGETITTDNCGNIYVAGGFVDTVKIGTYTLHGRSLSNIFLVKYDSGGNVLWAEQSKGLDNNNWTVGSISIDNAKHIYLSGYGGQKQCEVTFGGDTLSMYDTAYYDGASIIFKLDSNGNALCSSIIPAGARAGNVITSDTSGNYVYLGAYAATPVIFGSDTIDPFSYPTINPNETLNALPFAARWEACNPNSVTASISSPKTIGQVNLYPNPNQGRFTIALQNVNEPAQVEVYNVLGEQIYRSKLNNNNTQVNIGSQPEGIYFYRVITGSGGLVGNGKIIVEK